VVPSTTAEPAAGHHTDWAATEPGPGCNTEPPPAVATVVTGTERARDAGSGSAGTNPATGTAATGVATTNTDVIATATAAATRRLDRRSQPLKDLPERQPHPRMVPPQATPCKASEN
jgi:hypothetical protein